MVGGQFSSQARQRWIHRDQAKVRQRLEGFHGLAREVGPICPPGNRSRHFGQHQHGRYKQTAFACLTLHPRLAASMMYVAVNQTAYPHACVDNNIGHPLRPSLTASAALFPLGLQYRPISAANWSISVQTALRA